jgi:hypothetical protein
LRFSFENFSGQSNGFNPLCSCGSFVAEPEHDTPDFHRNFPVASADTKLGDGNIEAVTDWTTFKAAIDAEGRELVSNINFAMTLDGTQSGEVQGTIRSVAEHSWSPAISHAPTHVQGRDHHECLWIENNFQNRWSVLKNTNGGINVCINECANDPLDVIRSFSEDSPTLTAGKVDGSCSLKPVAILSKQRLPGSSKHTPRVQQLLGLTLLLVTPAQV